MRNSVQAVHSGGGAGAPAPNIARHDRKSLTLWLALLAIAQMADVITTQADSLRGGVEANHTAVLIMNVGGLGLFGALKLALVLGMVLAVTLAVRYRANNPGRHGELCVGVVARTIQLCVGLLTLAVLGNASVAAQLTS